MADESNSRKNIAHQTVPDFLRGNSSAVSQNLRISLSKLSLGE